MLFQICQVQFNISCFPFKNLFGQYFAFWMPISCDPIGQKSSELASPSSINENVPNSIFFITQFGITKCLVVRETTRFDENNRNPWCFLSPGNYSLSFNGGDWRYSVNLIRPCISNMNFSASIISRKMIDFYFIHFHGYHLKIKYLIRRILVVVEPFQWKPTELVPGISPIIRTQINKTLYW